MDKKLIRKTYQAIETKQAEGEDRALIVKISTISEDRSKDIVIPQGVILDNYLKNPVVAFAHNYNSLAIAKTGSIQITDDGVVAKVVFPKEGVYELADQLYALYKDGFMNAWSIGFIPIEVNQRDGGGNEYAKWELLEYSAVLVPDNPEALTILRNKGIDTKTLEEFIASKKVVPFKETPKADEGAEWNAQDELSVLWGDGNNQAKYAQVHTWYDDSVNDDDGDGYPDVKSAYKLPHHDRNLKVVWRGVAAAMAALLGARGGVDIPESDKKGVYNHLAKHYAQFDKEPLPFKSYSKEELEKLFNSNRQIENIEVDSKNNTVTLILENGEKMEFFGQEQFVKFSKELIDGYRQVKEGRVLSEKNRKLISDAITQMKEAIKAMDELLSATEPSSDEKKKSQELVIPLVEALKVADKVIGVALRDYKGRHGELGKVPDDSRLPVVVGMKGGE